VANGRRQKRNAKPKRFGPTQPLIRDINIYIKNHGQLGESNCRRMAVFEVTALDLKGLVRHCGKEVASGD